MPTLRLRLFLVWSLFRFASHILIAMTAAQRVLLAITLLAIAIGLSAAVSHTIIVDSAQELALNPPPAALVAQIHPTTREALTTTIQMAEAKVLWEGYKTELSSRDHNRNLLSNLILLASALGLEKDVMVYQRKLYLTDPLLSCTFAVAADGLLQINCPPSQL